MKTSVELNEEKVKLAKKLSHTSTLKELLEKALDAYISNARRRSIAEMLGTQFFEMTDKIWGLSSWNYFKCRKKGVTLTTLDCLIATVAKEYRISLWTLDKNIH